MMPIGDAAPARSSRHPSVDVVAQLRRSEAAEPNQEGAGVEQQDAPRDAGDKRPEQVDQGVVPPPVEAERRHIGDDYSDGGNEGESTEVVEMASSTAPLACSETAFLPFKPP